jgi:hypothetical protein
VKEGRNEEREGGREKKANTLFNWSPRKMELLLVMWT